MPEIPERRASERLSVSSEVACAFVAPVVETFGAAKIKNISLDGIGLIVGQRVEPGSLLAATLTNAARGFTKTLLIRVAHATPQPGGCLVGGTFETPLTYQELTNLVM
jgi:hypothetical protein